MAPQEVQPARGLQSPPEPASPATSKHQLRLGFAGIALVMGGFLVTYPFFVALQQVAYGQQVAGNPASLLEFATGVAVFLVGVVLSDEPKHSLVTAPRLLAMLSVGLLLALAIGRGLGSVFAWRVPASTDLLVLVVGTVAFVVLSKTRRPAA